MFVIERGSRGNEHLRSGRLDGSQGKNRRKAIRVLLVDDHVMIRQSVRRFLSNYSDLEVVGEANNGEEALECVQLLSPSVVPHLRLELFFLPAIWPY